MERKSMTALVSAFARAYHFRRAGEKVFADGVAGKLLTGEECARIGTRMAAGIGFFEPAFAGGGDEEALRLIVDRHLSPTPLARAAFAERALENAVRLGAGQYLILAAGYDTFAYRQPGWACELEIFEIDRPAMVEDKRARLMRAGLEAPANVHYIAADLADANWTAALRGHAAFDGNRISFCSLLGIAYYLAKRDFRALLRALGDLLPKGGALAFDYPAEGGAGESKQALLAEAAQENMQAIYGMRELEELLEASGFRAYEHLTPPEIARQFFAAHNRDNPDRPMRAQEAVNFCLAVKR